MCSGLMLRYTAPYSMGRAKSSWTTAAAPRWCFSRSTHVSLLANQTFPMFFLGGTMRPIIAPHPGVSTKPNNVLHYAASAWQGEMTLLEFLRKVNQRGEILEHIQTSHLKAGSSISLQQFAVRHEPFGEKVIAAEMVSMLNAVSRETSARCGQGDQNSSAQAHGLKDQSQAPRPAVMDACSSTRPANLWYSRASAARRRSACSTRL